LATLPIRLLALGTVLALGAGCTQAPAAYGKFGADPFPAAREVRPTPPSDCALTRRGTVPLTVQGLALVNARINGAPASLVLDTGAERSILSPDAAKRIGVTGRYDFNRTLRGIGNVIRTGDARLESFILGDVALSHPRILVGPIGNIGADGLLGADLLGDFDLELDLRRAQLTLYDRVECEGLRPPWTGPFVTLETTRSLSRHPFFPVEIDGHTLSATIDTGAQRTAMSASVAAPAGVSAAALAADPVAAMKGVGGEILRAAVHQFRSFSVGGDAFRGPVLVVPGIALPREAEVVIGMDYLLPRRMWLSYGSRRIFIAPG